MITDQRSAFIVIILGGIMGCLVMLPISSSAAVLTRHTGIESTLFAVLMSIFNFGQIIFGLSGGHFFSKIGLLPLILISGLASLSALFFLKNIHKDLAHESH